MTAALADPPMVFLDIGATLVTGPDSGPASRLAAALGLDHQAKQALKDRLLALPLQTPGDFAGLLVDAFGVSRHAAEREAEALWQVQRTEARAIETASDTVLALQAAGFRTGLISNIWKPYGESVMAALPSLFAGDGRCAPIVLSYETGRCKPDPAIFRHALRLAGVAADRAVMVGDSYNEDIEPALALGMQAVWVLHRPQGEREAVAGILNGQRLRPSMTLTAIESLTPALIRTLFDAEGRGRDGARRLAEKKESA